MKVWSGLTSSNSGMTSKEDLDLEFKETEDAMFIGSREELRSTKLEHPVPNSSLVSWKLILVLGSNVHLVIEFLRNGV